MRLVLWNCNMALHRKFEALLSLRPDIAVVCESAEPERVQARSERDWTQGDPIWVGQNPNKGLAVFAFNGYAVARSEPYYPTLHHIVPVHVSGPTQINLLAVWAQNASAGITRKHQSGPLRRALTKYRGFLSELPAIVAGDLNSNAIWDKPDWRINHMAKVRILQSLGLVSAYHELHGEAHGKETVPTLYWRDRRRDGPTYHLDYVFIPETWIEKVKRFDLGSFDDWCGSGLSDHVPIVLDIET